MVLRAYSLSQWAKSNCSEEIWASSIRRITIKTIESQGRSIGHWWPYWLWHCSFILDPNLACCDSAVDCSFYRSVLRMILLLRNVVFSTIDRTFLAHWIQAMMTNLVMKVNRSKLCYAAISWHAYEPVSDAYTKRQIWAFLHTWPSLSNFHDLYNAFDYSYMLSICSLKHSPQCFLVFVVVMHDGYEPIPLTNLAE